MIPTKYYLLYAKMHTRKYTTATYKPSDAVEDLREEYFVNFAKKGTVLTKYNSEMEMVALHEGALSTKYGVDIALTVENPETNEIQTLTIPREKVTVYRNLIATDAPYVFVGIDKDTNEPHYEIHVGDLVQDNKINLLHPTEED